MELAWLAQDSIKPVTTVLAALGPVGPIQELPRSVRLAARKDSTTLAAQGATTELAYHAQAFVQPIAGITTTAAAEATLELLSSVIQQPSVLLGNTLLAAPASVLEVAQLAQGTLSTTISTASTVVELALEPPLFAQIAPMVSTV